MRKLYLILSFLSCITVHAQHYRYKLAGSFTIASIAVPENLGLQPGVEYRLNERISFHVQATFPIKIKPSDKRDQFGEVSYFRLCPELKYWYGKKNNYSSYISLRMSYAQRSFLRRNAYYFDNLPGDSVIHFDAATINSPVTTINLLMGRQTGVYKKLKLDFFYGAGIRFLHTTYTDVVNPVFQPRFIPKDRGKINSGYEYNGQKIFLNLIAGVKLTCLLWVKK